MIFLQTKTIIEERSIPSDVVDSQPATSPDDNVCLSKSNYYSMVSGIVIMTLLTVVSFMVSCAWYRKVHFIRDKQASLKFN